MKLFIVCYFLSDFDVLFVDPFRANNRDRTEDATVHKIGTNCYPKAVLICAIGDVNSFALKEAQKDEAVVTYHMKRDGVRDFLGQKVLSVAWISPLFK